MSHVTGINLLTCVNWGGGAGKDPTHCMEERKIDIYALYVPGHKMIGAFNFARSISLNSFIFRMAGAPSSLLSSP